MRVPIAHDLPKEEVRRRLRTRTHELGGMIPGGAAQVETDWVGEDRMNLVVQALGQRVAGAVLIEERQVVFELTLPPALSFMQPVAERAVRAGGTKLLEKK